MKNELYSQVDHLKKSEQEFVITYFQTGSLAAVKTYLNISMEESFEMWKDPHIQEAIRQINLWRHRQIFKEKMLNLEQIGSLLSSYITGEYQPLEQQISPREKNEAIKLLLEVHSRLSRGVENPDTIFNMNINLDQNVKDLSVKDIKNLLSKEQND